ncbi:MAG: hypothetical protein J5789_06895 [Oscillospiraceae bacterium]|nr:hypothetical protein [Oscillospiraceae bacterium]
MNHRKIRLGSLLLTLAMLLTLTPALSGSAGADAPDSSSAAVPYFPPHLDLREAGLVTQVKDQGQNETCWAFAISSAIESNALVRGYGEHDISEYQLAYALSHILKLEGDLATGEGPNCTENWLEGIYAENISSALLRGFGVKSEKDYPYSHLRTPLPEDGVSPFGVLYPDSCYTVPASDSNAIKGLVSTNGAMYVSICSGCWWDGYYSWTSNGAYLPEYSGDYHNDHFVAIVGWDDNYSRDNFAITPPGDGAWIMKNSWGPYYGESGFFYLSYYDAALNENNCATSITVKNERYFDKIYQYDGGMGVQSIDGVTDVVMNFTAAGAEEITGVRLKPVGKLVPERNYCGDWSFEGCSAAIGVYRGVFDPNAPEAQSPVYTQEYAVVYPDYQTVEFESAVPLTAGERYYVRISFDRPVSYAVDGKNSQFLNNYESVAEGRPGETCLRVETTLGTGGWKDTAELENNLSASACIRVLTKSRKPVTMDTLRELIAEQIDFTALFLLPARILSDFMAGLI